MNLGEVRSLPVLIYYYIYCKVKAGEVVLQKGYQLRVFDVLKTRETLFYHTSKDREEFEKAFLW